jgi:molybdenum cofactor cytidylyltransferase
LNEQAKFEGIILAAGLSKRMNSWKPGIEIDDIPILIRAIVPMVQICDKVIVVGGYNYNSLVNLLDDSIVLSKKQKDKIRLIENKNYIKGMFSSVKCGIQNVSPESNGIFISLGDMPFVLSSTYQKLIECFSEENQFEVFKPALFGKGNENNSGITVGHPILIKSTIVSHILQCKDDEILKDVLQAFKHKICPVKDRDINTDIDNISDLQTAKSYMKNLKTYNREIK